MKQFVSRTISAVQHQVTCVTDGRLL